MTTSGDSPSMAAASSVIGTPQGASAPSTISPRSRPALAGSESIAPIISIELFSLISRTMAAPMGPTPYCTARIFFFKLGSVALFRGFAIAGVRGGGSFPSKFGANTINQTRGLFNGIRVAQALLPVRVLRPQIALVIGEMSENRTGKSQAAEKVGYFVIPSEARNLSSI